MNRLILLLLSALFLLGINGAFQSHDKPDTIHYVSLNKAIQLGQYDGVTSVKELLSHGDIGLGSEEKLLSELIIVDGIPYGIRADGNSHVLQDHISISFASVKFFKADTSLHLQTPSTFKALKGLLDSVIGKNSFAAIRIDGSFPSIAYRSFYKQEKPYKPLEDAIAKMATREKVQGTLVGFFTPASAELLNSPGYHFHWLSADKTTGGHVLNVTLNEVKIEVDFSRDLSVELPPKASLSTIDLNNKVQ